MARKAKKRRYSRSAGDDVEREMRRYKKGDREERTWRSRRTREEPQAGDRDRPVRGAQEGQEGPEESLEAEDRQEEGVQENAEENLEENFEEDVEAQIRQAVALTVRQIMLPGMKQRIDIPNAVLTGHTMVRPARLGSVMTASSGHLDPLARRAARDSARYATPVGVGDGKTIRIRAARTEMAAQAVEPRLERGIGVAAVVAAEGASGRQQTSDRQHEGRDQQRTPQRELQSIHRRHRSNTNRRASSTKAAGRSKFHSCNRSRRRHCRRAHAIPKCDERTRLFRTNQSSFLPLTRMLSTACGNPPCQ